jgi:hypothetical protein
MNPLSPKTLKKFLSVFVMLGLIGCGGSRVVFVPDSGNSLVRIGPDVKGYIYTWEESNGWVLSKNKVYLPEGWYAGSMDVGEHEE